MSNILKEAVNIDGSQFIGNGNGYDLFRILTFDAAQEFIIENTADQPAGTTYVQNQQTFNDNINDEQKLYFFTEENTNKVCGGVVKNNTSNYYERLEFIGEYGNILNLNCNFLFEDAANHTEQKIKWNKPLPFYLIPQAHFENQLNNDRFKSLVVDPNNGRLLAVLSQFVANVSDIELDLTDLPEQIEEIDSNAFNYGVAISDIKLTDRITYVGKKAMNNVNQNIYVTALETPESWDTEWNLGMEDFTNYGCDMSQEDIDAVKAQKQAEIDALELQRQQELEKQARLERQKLRYRIKGNEVIITGTIPGVHEIRIPEIIEGKTVTTIGAFAFFDEEDLSHMYVPKTLKLIERDAFYNTNIFQIYIPTECIVSKGNTNVTFSRKNPRNQEYFSL